MPLPLNHVILRVKPRVSHMLGICSSNCPTNELFKKIFATFCVHVCACVLMVVHMQDETLMDVKACHAEFLTLTQIRGTERSCNV